MFISMGYDWPVEITIDNISHAVVGAANYIMSCERVDIWLSYQKKTNCVVHGSNKHI